jgi:GNAT superfamily N-acetyltransferase
MERDRLTDVTIARVGDEDVADLLPLLRAYCDFYRVSPPAQDLVDLCRVLIADPDREGLQLIARDQNGRAVGFATIHWTWSTTHAGRLGVMNDLFVAEGSRGAGVAEALIEACR